MTATTSRTTAAARPAPPVSAAIGVVQEGEQCDDGNEDTTDMCPACQFAFCGDGFVQAGVEFCDDGNLDNDDACIAPQCVPAECGDGFIQAGVEECDDGNFDDDDDCPGSCVPSFCGDGFEHAEDEECDDGNNVSMDGCTADCIGEFPQVCTEGNDPGTNAPFVVCEADANEAWIAANNGGQYHPVLICEDFSYDDVGEWAGTCGNVCGRCEGDTSCMNPGQKIMTSQWNGSGNCGQDMLGPILCTTVHWTCVNN